MGKMIWSESLGEMVIAGFVDRDNDHYTWDDKDCLWWSDDDELYYMEVPEDAALDQ